MFELFCTTNPNPVRLTWNSLQVNSHREKSVFITGNPVLIAGILFSLQGFPYKTLFFPLRDCSVEKAEKTRLPHVLKHELSHLRVLMWIYLLMHATYHFLHFLCKKFMVLSATFSIQSYIRCPKIWGGGQIYP